MTEVHVGIIMLIVSFCGVISNWTVVLFMKRISSLSQSFGTLTRNQAIADAFHASIECFLVVPMVIFNIPILKAHSNILSFLLLITYDTSVLTHLLISFNRFFAVFCPVKYYTLYRKDITLYMILLADLISFISTGLIYASGCTYSWSDTLHSFLYHADEECLQISFYGLFCKYIGLVILILSLDMCSIIKAKLFCGKQNVLDDRVNKRKRTKEYCFLIQTCLQGSLFACELVCYFLISPHIEDTLIRFFLTTFAYSLIHATDGALSILCNEEFRAFVFKGHRGNSYGTNNQVATISNPHSRIH